MTMRNPDDHQLWIDRSRPEIWSVVISNPPINMLDGGTIEELQTLLLQLEADERLKVVVFESADPDFFIAHSDPWRAAPSAEAWRQPSGNGDAASWAEFVLRFSKAPIVTIAKIAGRARGVGNEFLLACDLRFASRQKAIFGQPEVGLGVIPGGGALEWLPRLVGRSRALEIVLGAEDLNADTAELYGMINRAVDDGALDAYVEAFASRIAAFDKQALRTAKELISRTGIPESDEISASGRALSQALTRPGAQARRKKLESLGFAERSEIELNLGDAIKSLDWP
jgi:enoyl-CoA hydratase/carnithine racemase